jgi:pimeloyl-ACP methyl ester carboxylesterase
MDPVTAAAEIDVPLLVVHGERDDLFPAEHARRISAAAGQSTLWVLPELGHAEGAVDQPLARRIAEWLVAQCQQ